MRRQRERSPETGENKISYFQKLAVTASRRNQVFILKCDGTIAKFVGSIPPKTPKTRYLGIGWGCYPSPAEDGKRGGRVRPKGADGRAPTRVFRGSGFIERNYESYTDQAYRRAGSDGTGGLAGSAAEIE